MGLKWMRLDAGLYRTTCGHWTIAKEHFADGPSLFTWVIFKDGTRVAEANTLRAAKNKIEPA